MPSTRCSDDQRRYTSSSASVSSTISSCSEIECADSPDCRPDTICPKNGSMPSVRAGRAMTRPIESARDWPSARAALCGRHCICSAIARIRARVCSLTPGRPFSANETAPLETPARSAMSAIVGRTT